MRTKGPIFGSGIGFVVVICNSFSVGGKVKGTGNPIPLRSMQTGQNPSAPENSVTQLGKVSWVGPGKRITTDLRSRIIVVWPYASAGAIGQFPIVSVVPSLFEKRGSFRRWPLSV